MRSRRLILCAFAAAVWLLSGAPPDNIAALRRDFANPPDDARIMMRWWWFGPAVVKPELELEMRKMKEGGIGGFEVQPVYPLELDDPAHGFRNLKYLSPEFLDALSFTAQKAKELGLRFDLTLGSGWPYGGPHINVEQASTRLTVARSGDGNLPRPLGEGEKLIAAVPSAKGDTVFFIQAPTRQTVKRPSFGGEGWVLDHYSRAALDTHLKTAGEPMLNATSKNPPYAVFSDSLEVYGANWTSDFLDEFRKRRGYDLKPLLIELFEGTGERAGAVSHDFGKTLSELADERYLKPLADWAHAHNTKLRSQTYGIPPVTLSSAHLADFPEGEGSQWRSFSTSRWASSSSHLYGRSVTSSETWTWLHSPVFRATPLDMKAEADVHFLQGVNQLIGHGWPYSPPEAGEPGWRFYASAVFNNHNPWWLVMPDVAAYLQRISYLLRQGRPVNDVALYLPTADAFAHFRLGAASVNQQMDTLIGSQLIPEILSAGYNFDFIDDAAIANAAISHRILILPGVERIPLATLQKIIEYAKGGGTVVAMRHAPSLAPGLKEAETDTPKIRELAKGIRVLDGPRLSEALHPVLAADVEAAPEIGFVHRKLDIADVYFIANTSNHPMHAAAKFRIDGLDSAWWDPFTGKVAKAGGNRLQFDLAPYESRVVAFSKERVDAVPAPSAPVTTDLSSGWKVTFPSGTETMDTLHSWTDKYYSGQATYEKTVTVPAWKGRAIYLNFGEGMPVAALELRSGAGMRAMFDGPVREAAVVYVNGKRAGSVWCAPYEVNVTGLIKNGENQIRIVVANSALNVLAKGPLPDYKALTAKYGERFQAQDMQAVQPQPSGLLGPVRLVAK